MNEPVAERHPAFPWKQPHEVLLHFLGLLGFRETKPTCEPKDVRVNYDALALAKSVAQYHIGGFPRDARQGHEIFHSVWDFTIEFLNNHSARRKEGFGFVPVKAGGRYEPLKLLL
jgi:hypothetical protein